MSKSNNPTNPDPAREDAFKELAAQGFASVEGDHAARLARMRETLGLPATDGNSQALERTLKPRQRRRRWMAPAAAAAILVVGLLLTWIYTSSSSKVATAKLLDASEERQEANPDDSEASGDTDPSVFDEKQRLSVAQAVPETPSTESSQIQVRTTADESPVSMVPPTAEVRIEERTQGSIASEEDVRNANATEDARDLLEPTSREQPVLNDASAIDAEVATNDVPDIPEASSAKDLADEAEARQKAMANANAAQRKKESFEESASVFRLRRGANEKLRTVEGRVLDNNGMPIEGARVMIEDSAHEIYTDKYGIFEIRLPASALVATVTYKDRKDVSFDVTVGNQFEVTLVNSPQLFSKVSITDSDNTLRQVAPFAEPFEAFESYLKSSTTSLLNEGIIVQFEITKNGRPKRIVGGPGKVDRSLLKEAKKLLQEGPDWPEKYRKKAWRYEVSTSE